MPVRRPPTHILMTADALGGLDCWAFAGVAALATMAATELARAILKLKIPRFGCAEGTTKKNGTVRPTTKCIVAN